MSNRVTMGQDDSMMLQRDTLPMQVLNKLMDWIMDGKLKMGEKLNTEELARQLGVSRMPIREALKSLEKMGLAESIPCRGKTCFAGTGGCFTNISDASVVRAACSWRSV